MGIWKVVFEYGGQLEYHLKMKGSVTDFTEKLTNNLFVLDQHLQYI